MPFAYQCDLKKQDCEKLYNPRLGGDKLNFTSQSCVRDNRLEGNVGRCGFPGAPCVVDANGDNCAGGSGGGSASICRNGFCAGEAGAKCSSTAQCNWGINCNSTSSGICGGYYAYMNNLEDWDGLPFAKDYCLSGLAFQDPTTKYWLCADGPPMALTTPPTETPDGGGGVSTGLIAGVSVAGAIIVLAVIGFCWWKKPLSALAAKRRNARGPVEKENIDGSPLDAPHNLDGQATAPPDNRGTAYLPEIQADTPAMVARPIPTRQMSQPTTTWFSGTTNTGTTSDAYTKQGDKYLSPAGLVTSSNTPQHSVPGSPQDGYRSTTPSSSSPRRTDNMSPGPPPTYHFGSPPPLSPLLLAQSTPLPPDNNVDAVERRLLQMREEAERGLRELREQRSMQSDRLLGPSPPPKVDSKRDDYDPYSEQHHR